MASPRAVELNIESLGTEIVTILVGPKRKTFSIHKKLICNRSEYFNKAFNGNFIESQGVMYLPKDDPEPFDALVTFIYQGRLPRFPTGRGLATSEESDSHLHYLSRVFYLAEKLCLNDLANRVMDNIQDLQYQHHRIFSVPNLRKHYQNTHNNSKLRLFSVSMICLQLKRHSASKNSSISYRISAYKRFALENADFGADCLSFMADHGTRVYSRGFNPLIRSNDEGLGQCFFHTHAKGEVCHLDVVHK